MNDEYARNVVIIDDVAPKISVLSSFGPYVRNVDHHWRIKINACR